MECRTAVQGDTNASLRRSRQSRSRDQKSELYGRVLVVICAEQYASRLVVPQSQRTHPSSWSSHKDQAAKALKKLAGPHLPASLKELDRAITRAHRDYETAAEQTRQPAGPQPPAGAPDGESQCDQPSDTEVDVDEEVALDSIVDDEDAPEDEDEDEPGLRTPRRPAGTDARAGETRGRGPFSSLRIAALAGCRGGRATAPHRRGPPRPGGLPRWLGHDAR